MRSVWKSRPVLFWLVLIVLTIVSVELLQAAGFSHWPRFEAALVISIAGAKARIVGREYMALADAPLLFRLFLDLWLVAVVGLLVFFFQSTS